MPPVAEPGPKDPDSFAFDFVPLFFRGSKAEKRNRSFGGAGIWGKGGGRVLGGVGFLILPHLFDP